MNWIRVVVDIQDDPKIEALAEALKVQEAHAVGLVVLTLVKLPAHAVTGDLKSITDKTLEKWAGWHGKRGQFSEAFRLLFCTDGVVTAWEKHNGAPIRKAAADAEAKRRERERRRDVPPDVGPPVGSYETNETNETGRDVPAVPVLPAESKGQLKVVPPTQNTRTRGTPLKPVGEVMLEAMRRAGVA